MPYVEQRIEIATPVHTAFEYVANQPEKMPGWWRTFELQERVSPAPTGVGSVSRYVYNMMGIKIKGEHRVLIFEQDRFLKVATTSGIESTFEFIFTSLERTPSEAGTLLTVRVDYRMPGALLGQFVNRMVVEEQNARGLAEGLNNLKALLES